MSNDIKNVNIFWEKICQLFDQTEIGEKKLFIFEDNYEAEEIISIENRIIDESEGMIFTTKLQWVSFKHGCSSWRFDLSQIVDVDCVTMILTVADGPKYKFRVEDEDYDFGHEDFNRAYYPFDSCEK